MNLQTHAHLTLTLECHAKTIRLSGSLTERTGSVHSSGMEVVEAMKIGSTLRPSAWKTAWGQVSGCHCKALWGNVLPPGVMVQYNAANFENYKWLFAKPCSKAIIVQSELSNLDSTAYLSSFGFLHMLCMRLYVQYYCSLEAWGPFFNHHSKSKNKRELKRT